MKLSVVIPVYYNEGSLKPTHQKILSLIDSCETVNDFEFIFVDDGSKDGSYNELLKIKECNDKISIIKLTRNFGQVAAIYAGYKLATGDIIVTLSADLQDPPELIINMIHAYENKEGEIVICSRIDRDEGLLRKITSKMFYKTMKTLSFPNMPTGGFDYVLISNKVLTYLNGRNESNTFWQGQILWSGYSIKFIPYLRNKREFGTSRWTSGKKVKYLIDGILGYSYLPIRLISLVGILVFLSGLVYSIVILIQFFLGDQPFKGWTPLMLITLFLSGFQLLMLGIIGEYLWRALDQVRNRPQFLIEEIRQ